MAVTTQPQPNTGAATPMLWTDTVTPLSEMTPGLEYFTNVDQLNIKHDLTEVTLWNKYNITNSADQAVFHVHEVEGDLNQREYWAPIRGFTIEVVDKLKRKVLTIRRPFKMCVCCPCCADGSCKYPIFIYDSNQEKIGSMQQRNSCCSCNFSIYDSAGNEIYQLSCKCCRCGNENDFTLTSKHGGQEAAKFTKHETFSDVGEYKLSFPMDMDALHKALVFSSVFMIEMVLYGNEMGGERTVNRGSNRMTTYT